MRCLYCGKQLALLRRLTGGGEFCSDAHKQSYQEEYNRLALSRLLQAQSKPGEIKTHANRSLPTEGLGQPLPPGSSRHRALSSSSPEPEYPSKRASREAAYDSPVEEKKPVERYVDVQASIVEETTRPEEPQVRRAEESVPKPRAVQEPVFEPPVYNRPPGGRTIFEMPAATVEEPPPPVASFVVDTPAWSWMPDGTPYAEAWSDQTAPPASPPWEVPAQYFTLATPDLTQLDLAPPTGERELPPVSTEISSTAFAQGPVDLSLFAKRSIADFEKTHAATPAVGEEHFFELSTAGLLPLEVRTPSNSDTPRAADVPSTPVEFDRANGNFNLPLRINTSITRAFPAASPVMLHVGIAGTATRPTSLNGTVNFPIGVSFEDSSFLALSPASVEFPPEDAEVILAASWADGMFAHETALAPPDEKGAGHAVEPTSTPRQSLEALSRLHQDLAREQEQHEEHAASVEAITPEVEIVQEVAAIAAPAEAQAVSSAIVDIPAEPAAPVHEEPIPRAAHELLEIPLKTFAPAKPSIMLEAQALVSLAPQAPQLKALPLRPKVAKVPPGFSPQSGAPGKGGAAGPKNASPAVEPRVEAKIKPVVTAPVKRPAPPIKTVPAQPAKPAAKASPETKPAEPAKKTQAFKPGIVEPKPAEPKTSEPTQPPKQAAAAQASAGAATETRKAEPKVASATEPDAEAMPSFARVQTRKKVSFLASLKFKLIVAIVLVGGAGTFFIVKGGKNQPPPAAEHTTAAPEDVAGPSIMMGEGGWVQNWGGDVNGAHSGRQITIYRPSLKLSDYRIEFQGEIDSKSMGWVFRALDPYNYYAAKLAIAPSNSTSKFVLVKYAVEQGHETELGRTPVNVDAGGESVLNVRMDVRGNTFRTYIQGQPVDVWTDAKFKSGGVGLLNERAERARVKSIAIYYLAGGKN